jgi:hypothetical protein
MDTLSPDHPRHKLAFYVAQDVDFDIRAAVAEFVSKVGSSRSWLLGPPQYFDIHEVGEEDNPKAHCADDVGAFIEIYSGWPPWSVPRGIDRQLFDEATALLTALEEFSRERNLDFEVFYAGEVIGYVTDGKMDGVREMLLDEWERSFHASPTKRRFSPVERS